MAIAMKQENFSHLKAKRENKDPIFLVLDSSLRKPSERGADEDSVFCFLASPIMEV
jgi:hypothetical protein